MSYISLLPSWSGLHPLIIHFPIALLLVAPLFVLAGTLLPPRHSRSFLLSALILMALGTIAVFFSVETGEAAREIARTDPLIKAAVDEHEELAEATEVLFTVLTIAFAGLLYLPNLLRTDLGRRVNMALLAVFLIFYASGVHFLIHTAHHGGLLVHELGVRSMASPSFSASANHR